MKGTLVVFVAAAGMAFGGITEPIGVDGGQINGASFTLAATRGRGTSRGSKVRWPPCVSKRRWWWKPWI